MAIVLSISHGAERGNSAFEPSPLYGNCLYPLASILRACNAASVEKSSRIAMDTFLESTNWRLQDTPSTKLEGATPGYAQELNSVLHLHLELQKTMVHVPKVGPGHYVAWHLDSTCLLSAIISI